MGEAAYQNSLIKKIENRFRGCYIFRNDPRILQGVPDLLILFEDKWAMLEVKIERVSVLQPNQEYYLNLFNSMSFAALIYPENEAEVLFQLEEFFG